MSRAPFIRPADAQAGGPAADFRELVAGNQHAQTLDWLTQAGVDTLGHTLRDAVAANA